MLLILQQLSEDSGLLEWVPHTSTYRDEVLKCYKQYKPWGNGAPSTKDIKDAAARIKGVDHNQTPQTELRFYKEWLLQRFPPIFHKWHVLKFPTPRQWYEARLAYTRTLAVWSMVGHVLGMGDRHGENILLDGKSGGIVQIDFGCLFEKGLSLEKPELVPFRLTSNMVSALGASGIEGGFRRSCELTLGLLRANRSVLMVQLDANLHDPLIEWKSHSDVTSQNTQQQQVHQDPFMHKCEYLKQSLLFTLQCSCY